MEQTIRAQVTTPANTAEVSPQRTALALPQMELVTVTLMIPDGHVGLTGFALEYSGGRLVPFEQAQWIKGNDVTLVFPLGFALGGNDVTLVTFNADEVYEHTHYLYFHLADLTFAAPASPAVVPVGPLVFAGR